MGGAEPSLCVIRGTEATQTKRCAVTLEGMIRRKLLVRHQGVSQVMSLDRGPGL